MVLHNSEQDIIDNFRSLLPESDTMSSADDTRTNAKAHRVRRKERARDKSDTKTAIDAYGLGEADCFGKFIPTGFLYGSIKERVNLLRGLIDSDGSVNASGRGVEYSTVSDRLADDICFLARSLGGVVRRARRQTYFSYLGEKRAGAESWRLQISFPSSLVPVSSAKHLSKWKEPTYQMGRFIESVEYVDDKECQCILVDCDDHLYVTDDFIVTHNTSLLVNLLDQTTDHVVYLMSVDKGNKRISMAAEKYGGRMALDFPTRLKEFRKSINEVAQRAGAVAAKRGAGKVWVVVDTVTHMQMFLMAEARTFDVKESNKPSGKAPSQPPGEDEIYVRDMTTRADYNINLTHMVELSNQILKIPCNIVFMALEKQFKSEKTGNEVTMVALSGQSKDKILGDSDIIARMVEGGGGSRVFITAPGNGVEAGDRNGKLGTSEPADLLKMYNKIYGTGTAEQSTTG